VRLHARPHLRAICRHLRLHHSCRLLGRRGCRVRPAVCTTGLCRGDERLCQRTGDPAFDELRRRRSCRGTLPCKHRGSVMAVTVHCNGKTNSLVHKGNGGFTKNTIPDVCKTPSPGGPVPIPYPVIVSMSSDLDKGTKTVKIDGGNMVAIKGSEFSRCTGDEA